MAAFAYVGTVDPNAPGHYPVCPLLHYTGLYCPAAEDCAAPTPSSTVTF